MNKYNKNLTIIFAVSMSTLTLSLIAFQIVASQYKYYFYFLILLSIALFPVYIFFSEIITVLKNAWSNLSKCNLECFNKINKIIKSKENTNSNFERAIMYINHTYEFGEVKIIIDNKDIKSLYERKDFLLKNLTFFDDSIQCVSSLFISTIASILVLIIEPSIAVLTIPIFIISVGCFIHTIFFKYSKRGQFESYTHFIYKYELSLLDKAISEIQNNMKVNSNDIRFIWTIHNISEELFYETKKAKGKSKAKIQEDISIVENLNLVLEENLQYEIKEYLIINKNRRKKVTPHSIYIAYIIDQEGKRNYATKDFEKVFSIVSEYNFLYKE